MKTKQEIASLHTLFLSPEPANWGFAAKRCSKADFERIINLEVERFTNSEDFEFVKAKDEDSEGFEYEHKLMLGVEFWLFIDRGTLESDNWVVIERAWEISSTGIDIAWTELKYDAASGGAEKIRYWTKNAADSWPKGPRNQYLTEDFAAELETVKEYWRNHFKQLKKYL